MATLPPVAIIGAGPGGLSFARLLEIQGIDYIIFERDASSERLPYHQGGTLDIHASSGQKTVKKAGLFEEFKKLARWDGTRMSIQDSMGTIKKVYDQERDAPEIDRFQLRKMLLGSIHESRIRWGHAVASVERHQDDNNGSPRWKVNFLDGTSANGFTPIVGADGAWSKVRPLLTATKPEFSGKMFIEGYITHENPQYHNAMVAAGPGTHMAMGGGRLIGIQQVADASYRLYLGLTCDSDLLQTTLDIKDTSAARKQLLESPEFYADFAPELRAFVEHIEGPFWPWLLHRMPVSSVSWDRVLGVVLLGDAAHASTPFVGEGVNQALCDALQLAESIFKHCIDEDGKTSIKYAEQLERALADYEREMFARAQDFITRCISSENILFSENAAQTYITTVEDPDIDIYKNLRD